MRAIVVTVVLGALSSTTLVAHTLLLKRNSELSELRSPRRYWEDVCAAAKGFLDYKYTPDPAATASRRFDQGFELCSRLVIGGASRQQVRPWQFWRTIHLRPFIHNREHLVELPPFSDPGRSAAAAIGFRLLGGISPFLVLWLGVFAAVPVLWWTAWECARARVEWMGALFLILLASSPFFVECLTLIHSGLGFYVIALVAIVPVAVYATLSSGVTARGLLLRALVGGGVLGLCAVCRSASMALVPGFLLALVLGWWRMEGGRDGWRWAVLAAAAVLLLAPYAALKPARHHDVWISIWEGLGDFDRTKGHYWQDEEAKRSLVAAGIPLGKGAFGWVTNEAEAHFKRLVLRDITSDPSWFAGILLRRVWATVTQEKLRAWSSKDWRWITASLTPNESGMDKTFSRTTPVNRLGSGRAHLVVPVLLLIVPTVLLLALAAWGPARSRTAAWSAQARRGLPAVACVGAGALALPVAITSAGMLETQAYALTYYLGFALLVQVTAGHAVGREIAAPASRVEIGEASRA